MFDILLLGVWMSDETLFLVFDILLVGVWISDETLFLVFDILLLSVWISDDSLFPCLIYYFSVFGYQTSHSFSCLLLLAVWISDESLFLVFDILLFQCLDVSFASFIHKNESTVFICYFSMLRNRQLEFDICRLP